MMKTELHNLLSSISHMAMHGDIPINAFGTLLSSAHGEIVAEHLHQRWLSDPNFAKIAAQIVFQLHGIENRNVAVCSQVLAHALRDFKSRRKIRKRSRHMFRNYLRTLIALYAVYKKIDKLLSACLIEPLFRCLQILVDDVPDDNDLRCVANIMIFSGQMLSQLNPVDCDNTVIKCRKWLTSNSIYLEETTKFLLLNMIDLWTYSWNINAFPDSLHRFYIDYETYNKNIKDENFDKKVSTISNKKISVKLQRQVSINPEKRLSRHPSVMDVHFNALANKNYIDSDSDSDLNVEKKENLYKTNFKTAYNESIV